MGCFRIEIVHRVTPLSQTLCVRQVATSVNTPPNHFRLSQRATFTREISTGTSTSGPMTAAKAAPWWMPNVAIATAMASSKLLLDAVKESVVASALLAPSFLLIQNETKNLRTK